MSLHQPYSHVEEHPIFRRAPSIGFTANGVFVPFVTFRTSDQPPDWQGGRIKRQDPIPGSSRWLTQDLGAAPLTYTTGVMFSTPERLRVFWTMQNQVGTLRLNLSRSMWAADREWHDGGVDYAEWDEVQIAAVGALTFDVRGYPQLNDVVFQREDSSWTS